MYLPAAGDQHPGEHGDIAVPEIIWEFYPGVWYGIM